MASYQATQQFEGSFNIKGKVNISSTPDLTNNSHASKAVLINFVYYCQVL